MINLIRSLFSGKPKQAKEVPHVHVWAHQYSTGNNNSVWTNGDKTGVSMSDVYRCECGQWSVKHRSDKDREFILI